ncbi:Alpha/beta hydrolase family protein [Pseudovibrio sp. Ad13]|uniref:alpha/beta hydrolase n=1 Tax=Pseudovibrio sp. Ad13 TaxID=989396 RepID=UPI0007AEC87E|nr:alpha/beta hydrolase [Pseudovibrio sp. Ad13]KZK84647.1 Alpha/beta hydrolase family protein [Pseudovibrio sp. Ad13]
MPERKKLGNNLDKVEVRPVEFECHGEVLHGDLYLPKKRPPNGKLPGVVVTGAWTSVKEQMAGLYASELAMRGFVALAFDFRGWGLSAHDGKTKYLEDPVRKTDDIRAAIDFMGRCPDVNPDRICGLGICASAGYMSAATGGNRHVHSLALVAPWLHNSEIISEVYGGVEGVSNLMKVGRDALTHEEPRYIVAASKVDDTALMFDVEYYTEEDRGLIPEFDNKFNLASWEAWLTFDGVHTADKQNQPTLIVHSEAAAIPKGAKEFARRMGDRATTLWFEDVSQFDFYDKTQPIDRALEAVAEHFLSTL